VLVVVVVLVVRLVVHQEQKLHLLLVEFLWEVIIQSQRKVELKEVSNHRMVELQEVQEIQGQ
jgi:hypothetical protein